MGAASSAGYGQFCPIAKAAELVCKRWTVLVLREFCCGSTRFGDLRKGLPRMSPTLLTERLRELEREGLLERVVAADGAAPEYRLTPAGAALQPVIESLGEWGYHWIESSASLANLDPSLLMWDIHRNIDPTPLPPRRCVIQFLYRNLPRAARAWWLVVEPDGAVDLCSIDRGFEIDLQVATDLSTMTGIWMGYASLRTEIDAGRVQLTGDPALKIAMPTWLKLSVFARKAARSARPEPMTSD